MAIRFLVSVQFFELLVNIKVILRECNWYEITLVVFMQHLYSTFFFLAFFLVTSLSANLHSGDFAEVEHNCKDESEVVQKWCFRAIKIIDHWYPLIVKELDVKSSSSSQINLVIKDMGGYYGYSVNNEIQINRQLITRYPAEFGVVIHELTHLVQEYTYPCDPGNFPSWLSEGIADYFQWVRYEGKPQEWFPVDAGSQGYRQGYRHAAGFLFWLEKNHYPEISRVLHQAIYDHSYNDSLFAELTGKSLNVLWSDYQQDMTMRTSSMPGRLLALLGNSISGFTRLFYHPEAQDLYNCSGSWQQ